MFHTRAPPVRTTGLVSDTARMTRPSALYNPREVPNPAREGRAQECSYVRTSVIIGVV